MCLYKKVDKKQLNPTSVHWDPMWGILILADLRPMGYNRISIHSVIVLGLGKSLLSKSVLGQCVRKNQLHYSESFSG